MSKKTTGWVCRQRGMRENSVEHGYRNRQLASTRKNLVFFRLERRIEKQKAAERYLSDILPSSSIVQTTGQLANADFFLATVRPAIGPISSPLSSSWQLFFTLQLI
jgi:hypothetical protein